MAGDLLAAARQWQSEGWAIVDGLIREDEVDAVAGDLERLFAADTFADYNRASGFGDGPPGADSSARRSSTVCAASHSQSAQH
jgi:hypothetical protein